MLRFIEHPDVATPLRLTSDLIRIDWYDNDEGVNGDYDPDDPEDIALLRFDVYYRNSPHGRWKQLADESYLTGMPVDTDMHILKQALHCIYQEYSRLLPIRNPDSIRHVGEHLSAMTPDDFTEEM